MNSFSLFSGRFFLVLIIPLVLIFNLVQAQECSTDFLDGLFKSQMKEHRIAGATFSMYSADSLQLTRSWGYSHVEEDRMADENTGFMIGSISKLFVWVSVMQLVEQGKLDLNTPVNDYLSGFRLPDDYKPVTMKHLMTHTPGFESNLHLFSKSYESLPELETYLIENLPAQIFEPGSTPAYSNYGVTLAGYVIEQISGMDFNDYVEKNIFLPLGMNSTTFRQPASFAISEAKSKGYVWRNGKITSPFDEYVLPSPAGSAVSTSTDMLVFMSAMLNKGDSTILKEETIDRMFGILNQPHPESNGMAYGFMRMEYFGKEIFWHGGDTYFFHSSFMLVPALKTGIFISVNTAETGFDYLEQSLLILDYLNGNHHELSGVRRVSGMNHFAGIYKPSRITESSYLKIFSPFMYVKVEGGPEGILLNNPGGKQELYTPYDQDVFVSQYKKLIFQRNEKGKINQMSLSHMPIITFERISIRENPTLNIVLLAVSLLIILRNMAMPVIRLFKGDKRSRQLFRWLLLLSGLLVVLFLMLFANAYSGVEKVIFEKPQNIGLILLLPLASLILFGLALVFWIQGLTWSRQPISATFWQFVGFVVMALFYFQMNFWNLFNFMV